VQVTTETAYDRVPYPGHPHAETHPNRLAAIAALFGLDAPAVGTARVLEVGCGDGGNLIPIACSLPAARCVGFDLAPSAIERGRARIGQLGLANARLDVADLTTVSRRFGMFDYVIAHGVYSWVPRPVRDALLALIRDSLSPGGVALVSYNTYPGWHVSRLVREMLRYHTREVADPAERVVQSKALVDFLAVAHPAEDAYGRLLAAESERIAKLSPGHLFHDDLAEVNQPVYFHELVAHARAHGLAFLAEADYATISGAELPDAARDKLEPLRGDPVGWGQYLDFVKGLRFRGTMLCHASQRVATAPVPGAVRRLLAAAAAVPDAQPVDLAAGKEAHFRWGERASLRTDHPLAKAAFIALLDRWRDQATFDVLLAGACSLLGRAPGGEDAEALEAILLGAFGLRMVELTAERWIYATRVGTRPEASRLARLEAEEGDLVTTLAHRRVCLDDPRLRQLLLLCDGTRDVDALVADLGASGHAVDRVGVEAQVEGFAKLGLLMPGERGS
jgi:SAM-dependent methyltransferase